MSSVTVVTVARRGDLPGARVLAAGLREHHPGWRHVVVLLPGHGAPPRSDEPFELLTARDLASHDLEQLAPVVPLAAVEDLARALAVERVLTEGADVALALAPDAEVHGPLDALVNGDADAAVVARVAGELPGDGERPDAQDLLAAGDVDDGIVAIHATEPGLGLAHWWFDRSLEAARAAEAQPDPRRQVASPNPLDAAQHTGARVQRVADTGVGVSYWNLHERPLAQADGDGVTAGGAPLALMRFAGFRPDRPWWLSSQATRVPVLDDPVLSGLCATRAAALHAAGWQRGAALDDITAKLPNGLRFDARLRRMYVEALERGEEFGDILGPAGADAFMRWLCEPAPQGARAGLTRYHHDVWLERRDVREAYPHLDAGDGAGFAGWLWVQGRPEMELQTALMPPWPEFLGEAPEPTSPPGVLVTGYLRADLGLGQAARGYIAALETAGVPVATRSLSPDPPVERLPRGARVRPEREGFPDRGLPGDAQPDLNLLCIQPDQVVEFAQEFGDSELRDRYTIGHWAWETDHVPGRWDAAFALVDELWAISTFVAEILARAGDVPVVVVPLPVTAAGSGGVRVPFELPGGFLFTFAFDHFSTIERKNPLGLIEAFRRAFEPGEGPSLLIKTTNAALRPEPHAALRHAAGDRPDIHIVDATLEHDELAALFERSDCYVSLHRSEGFGLTLAESMARGKPVIATGWSGNTDFMSPHNSYLVDHELTMVGDAAEHYPAEGRWAQPSVEHAAALMREVYDGQDAARARGARARADVEATLSVEAIASIAGARLQRIAALRGVRDAGTTGPPWPLGDLDERLYFDLERTAARGPRGLVQRSVFKALRPYTRPQRLLDETVAGSLHRLYADLVTERGRRERAVSRVADLERRLSSLERRKS